MTIEIKLDTLHHLSHGDRLEISGIVSNDIFEVVFSINIPKFKFLIDHNSGWDIFTWGMKKSEMDSGPIFSFLEYRPQNQFTLCFQINFNQILTLLNDTLLCTSELLCPAEEIISIKISGDNKIKYISFSDGSNKSSRAIQPAIPDSLEINQSTENAQVLVIESRKRIIFKNKLIENENLFSESDYESDEEDFPIDEIVLDSKYLKTFLLACKLSADDTYTYQYPNECPENKYVINYFNPSYSISDSEDSVFHSIKQSINYQQLEVESNNIKDKKRFNELKSHLEEIRKDLDETGYQIERYVSISKSISSEDESKLTIEKHIEHNFQIPVIEYEKPEKTDTSPTHYTKVDTKSKIPVLVKKSQSISD